MIKKKTVLNVLLILIIISFFVTPLGRYSKVVLNQLFSFAPSTIKVDSRKQLTHYNWQLKDSNWNFFSFEKSKGRVVFVNFWASWRLPCEAELAGIQLLYEKYQGQMDFYIITDENRPPVEKFMKEKKFTFPLTYLIIGEFSPIPIPEPPHSYLIDKNGFIVINNDGIADWNSNEVHQTIDELISQ